LTVNTFIDGVLTITMLELSKN